VIEDLYFIYKNFQLVGFLSGLKAFALEKLSLVFFFFDENLNKTKFVINAVCF
jgi:hypothetical protein